MTSKLEQLKKMTTVVADTGDIEAIKRWQPVDATTNPSLLLKAAAMPQYASLITKAIEHGQATTGSNENQLQAACDFLAVHIGNEILNYIPGRVSTEVDARLSFDTAATVDKAKQLVAMYESLGVTRDRILIKIASTWEGIKAAEILEKADIQCNLTLLFAFEQAVAAAEAGAFLISPFVGRILDWYKAASGRDHFEPDEDPGVKSVTRIYNHYKSNGFETIVMGASFRNTGEIEALAGCDRLTISPELLSELNDAEGELVRRLSTGQRSESQAPVLSEREFRWGLNEDAMATEKLAEGIRKFATDQRKLEKLLADKAS